MVGCGGWGGGAEPAPIKEDSATALNWEFVTVEGLRIRLVVQYLENV